MRGIVLIQKEISQAPCDQYVHWNTNLPEQGEVMENVQENHKVKQCNVLTMSHELI